MLHRAAFLHAALRTDGIVPWLEPVRTTRTGAGAYVYVFLFPATGDRLHIINSDVSVPFSTFQRGERSRGLYREDNPDIALFDALSTLWQESVVFGIRDGRVAQHFCANCGCPTSATKFHRIRAASRTVTSRIYRNTPATSESHYQMGALH